jgi:hypothetical protein
VFTCNFTFSTTNVAAVVIVGPKSLSRDAKNHLCEKKSFEKMSRDAKNHLCDKKSFEKMSRDTKNHRRDKKSFEKLSPPEFLCRFPEARKERP